MAYKYAGSDNSITFRKVLNPLYEKMLPFIPYWLAPNLITLIGFLFPLSAHILMAQYAPDLKGEAPTWLYFYCSVGLIAYMCLDALDGKQARRTGSSSPLGLLFDHGCDALNTGLSCMTLCSSLQLGSSWKTVVMAVSSLSTFYAATWEEYYTGELILPEINGPNEGVIIVAGMHVITGLFGPSMWLKTIDLFGGFQLNTAAVIFSAFSSYSTILMNIKNVFIFLRNHQRIFHSAKPGESTPQCVFPEEDSKSVQHSHPHATLCLALTRWVPLLLIEVAWVMWVFDSPSHIFERYPRRMLWIFVLAFCKMVTQLMLAHLTGEQYRPYGKTAVLILFRAYQVAYSIYVAKNYTQESEDMAVLELLFICGVSYLHLVIYAIWEITSILGIHCFWIDTMKAYNHVYNVTPAPVAAQTVVASSGNSATFGGSEVPERSRRSAITTPTRRSSSRARKSD